MKFLKLAVVFVVIASIGGGLWLYWQYSALHPSTQDAYVKGNIVTMAAQVPGRVVAVKVAENQHVSAGDVLVEIDPAIYENAVASARSQVQSASEAEGAFASQVDAAGAALVSARASLEAATNQLTRTQTLAGRGDVSSAVLDAARATQAQARAGVDAAQAQLSQARAAMVANRQTLASAKAQLGTAETNLKHTKIFAPSDGWVSNLSLRAGAIVPAYQPLFSIVEDRGWWVDANFKETDLGRIKEGQPASVTVDMLPGVTLSGKVQSLGAGSGATFALLPPQNASGNWVKVTQRFPVRIALEPSTDPLRAGASATVTVDTTAPASAGQ